MSAPIDTASVAIVPDFSSFAREAKAGIDAALRGLIADVERAFAGVERAAGEAGAEIGRDFQAGGESAERALREVDNQARRSFNEVSRQASEASAGIATKLGGALGVVKTGLTTLAVGAGAGLAALTGFGLKAAADLEQVQVSFDSLLGSADKGAAVFKDLQQFAACVDPATMAFTEDGWRPYTDLQVGQRILTINPATGRAEWQPIQAMHIYDGQHEVLRIEGQYHSSVSTLNHRWPIYARGQHRHRILFATSATLDEGDQLVAAAPLAEPPVEATHSDEFVELVAWFWTEGSIHPPSQDLDAPAARATIRQSMRANPDKCARIAAALEKEFGPAGPGNWGVTGPDVDGGMQWRLARDRAKQLVAAAPDRVPTMTFLRSLTAQQLDLFIAVSLLGDGHIRPQTGQMNLTQKRYDQAERFADAVSLSGRRCRLYRAEGRRWVVSVYRGDPRIGLSHARRSQVQWHRETYTGSVWCPQVANGTWFAQRDGYRFFTGNSTPFEFPEVAGASQRFLAFAKGVGLSDANLRPFLTTLGNVASVTGGGAQALNSVTLAMGQIASAGKVTLDNLNQISEALPGFSGVAAIASATGKTTAEVMKEISAGELDAKTGIQALLKGMDKFPGAAGAMEKQSQTLLGVFSTFKDTLSQTLVGAFQPVIPAIKDSLTQVTPILQSALQGIAPILGGVLSALLPLLGQIVQAIVPILGPIVDALGEGLKQVGPALLPIGQALGNIASAVSPVLPMIGELIALFAQQLVPIIQQLVPVFDELVSTILPLISDILEPLLPIIAQVASVFAAALVPIVKLVAKIFEKLGPPILKIVEALAVLLMPIIEALSPVLDQLIAAFLPFVDIIAALLPPLVEIIKAFMPLTDIIIALLPAITAIITPLAQLVALIVGFLAQKAIVPLVELLAKALVLVLAPLTLLPPLLESFTGWLNSIDWGAVGSAIGGFFADAWNHVVDFFVGIGRWFAGLPGKARDAFLAMNNAIMAKVFEMIGFVQSIPGRILNAIGNLVGLLFTAGQNVVHGLWNGISSLGGWLWSKVKQFAIDNTVGALKHALGISSPSQVMADQVGRQIPAGIAMGVQAGLPALQSMLNGLVPTGAAQPAAPATLGGVTINLGGIQFAGVVPTEAEARRTGAAAMAGAVDALRRRDLALAVRTV